jgi:hypothetical protein
VQPPSTCHSRTASTYSAHELEDFQTAQQDGSLFSDDDKMSLEADPENAPSGSASLPAAGPSPEPPKSPSTTEPMLPSKSHPAAGQQERTIKLRRAGNDVDVRTYSFQE